MTRRAVHFLALATALASLVTFAACSSTSPSSGASISGSFTAETIVTSHASGHASGPNAARPSDDVFTGTTVTVVGTNEQAVVDATNRFMLQNVPAGDVTLQIQGQGVSATVTVPSIQANQAVVIVLLVTGSAVSIESDNRATGTAFDADGVITAVNSNGSFLLNGATINTTASTTIVRGTSIGLVTDLIVGAHVHVIGTASGGGVNAIRIEIENATNTQVTVSGIVNGLSGTGSSFQFTLGGTQVTGDATTTITNGSFTNLVNGRQVTVQGLQNNGFVFATSIQLN
jgi:hypothetical protein